MYNKFLHLFLGPKVVVGELRGEMVISMGKRLYNADEYIRALVGDSRERRTAAAVLPEVLEKSGVPNYKGTLTHFPVEAVERLSDLGPQFIASATENNILCSCDNVTHIVIDGNKISVDTDVLAEAFDSYLQGDVSEMGLYMAKRFANASGKENVYPRYKDMIDAGLDNLCSRYLDLLNSYKGGIADMRYADYFDLGVRYRHVSAVTNWGRVAAPKAMAR